MPSAVKKDMHPQFLRLPLAVIPAAGATVVEVFVLTPIIPSLGSGKSRIIELLKVFVQAVSPPLQAVDENSFAYSITDRQSAIILNYEDAGCIVADSKHVQVLGARTAEPVAAAGTPSTIVYDLTDGAGNGPLFGGPSIHMQGQSDATLATTTQLRAAILFRLVDVSASEFSQALAFA